MIMNHIADNMGSTIFHLLVMVLVGHLVHSSVVPAIAPVQLVTGLTTGVPTTSEVTTPAPLTDFHCTIDDASLCGITQDPRNQFFWSWRGDSPQPVAGPVGDHTSGSTSGYYMFVPEVPSSQISEERGRIISPVFAKNSNPRCLQFYYYMNGVTDAGTLNVYILLKGGTLPLFPHWRSETNIGNVWNLGHMDIPIQNDDFQIVFEGVRTPLYDGSLAIDDISLPFDLLCPVLYTTCDFEDGLGDFVQDETDDMDWNLWSSSTPSLDTGPSFDHTYGNSSGHYIFIETSAPVVTGHVARLKSPLLISTKEISRCLVFWYHMYGIDVATLNVYITNGTVSSKPTYLWSVSGNRGDKWRAAEVHLESQVEFQVIMEAFRGQEFAGDIAIDDIIIYAAVCPGEFEFRNYSSISCNFEEREICYYEQDTTDDTDWIWQNGATDQIYTGPEVDHTTNTGFGFFLYISESSSITAGGVARLWSPMADPQPRPSCVEFWYHMYGSDVETLGVYINIDGQPLPVTPSWSISGNQGNYWHRATLDVPIVNAGFRIVFEGTTGVDYKDDIALDDVTFYNSSSCPIVTTLPPPPTTPPVARENANCDFESNDGCGYIQMYDDQMDWTIYAGSTPSVDTGPTTDHTLGTPLGYYMYLETSEPYGVPGDVAHLGSPYIEPTTNPRCMEFFYHMWGADVDMLNVYLVGFGDSMPIDPQLTLFGDQGDQWLPALVDIPVFSKAYQVIFEATKGPSFEGDIAIDDVTFYDGKCPRVTPDPAVINANCDFEQTTTSTTTSLCGYYQGTEDDFDWTLNSGGTSSDFTGPSADHTLGTEDGHYAYIETSIPRRPGQSARLISPTFAGTTDDLCLQFYYHMSGDDVAYLRVLWRAEYYEVQEKLRIVGDQGDRWLPGSVDLTTLGGDFELAFEAFVGSGHKGDIAIDDINILRQPCQGYPKESSCTFDAAGPDDFCGYEQSSLDDFDWQWYDGGNRGDAPVTSDSSYIYFSPMTSKPGDTARLVSPKIAGNSRQHCLDFDYVLSEDFTQQLTIAVSRNDGTITEFESLSGSDATTWKHHGRTLNDTEVGRNFQIIFIGVVGDGVTTDVTKAGVIALDNPTIRLGKCDELPSPDTGKSTDGGDDYNPSVTVLLITIGIILLVLALSGAAYIHYVYLPSRKSEKLLDVSIKYKNNGKSTSKDAVLPADLTIDNPTYIAENSIKITGTEGGAGENA